MTSMLKTANRAIRARLPTAPAARAATWVLRLPRGWPESAREVAWWWHDGHGGVQQGRATLDAVPPYDRQAQVFVWTPAAETLLTRATLPTRARAKILKALPFALEEQLLSEPENQHFAIRALPDGGFAVAVTERARAQAWLGALRAAGFAPAALCPVTLAIPLAEDGWALAWDEEEVWLRTGEFSGFACLAHLPAVPLRSAAQAGEGVPLAFLQTALREARAKGAAPGALTLHRPPPAVDTQELSAKLGLPVRTSEEDFWVRRPSPPPFNLMQGDFAGPTGAWRETARMFKPAALLIGLWLLLGFVSDLVEWRLLAREHTAQQQEMTDLFRRAFPEAKVVVDPALQMERNLAALQGKGGGGRANDLLPLLARAVPALTGGANVQLRSTQYADASLTLELTAPDYQALETLKSALSARGLKVETLGANSRPNGVDGKLRVRAQGAS